LIDGVEINELNSGGFYGGGQYNLSNIERVEVVYGPSSVAYGTNAVSGIINIITKNAAKKANSMNALLGSYNTYKTDFAYNITNNKNNFEIRLAGMAKKSDKANLKGTAGDNNWTDLLDNYEDDYSFTVTAQANGFTFGTNYQQKQTSTATTQKTIGTNYLDYGSFWNIRFINSYLKYEKMLSSNLKFSTQIYNRNSTVLRNTIYYTTKDYQTGYYRPNNLTGAEGILNYNSQKNYTITGGCVFEYEQLANGPSLTYSGSSTSKPATPTKPPMQKNYLASCFIEPTIKMLHSLTLSGGLRFDQSSIYDQVITPRAGLCFNKNKLSSHFSYAEAFRAPKPWDYTDGIGNNNLQPERMKSLEASVTISPFKNLIASITCYRNKLTNAIVKDTVGNSYRWANSGEINTSGLEFNVSFSTPKIHTYANYTFTESLDESDVLVDEISKHIANAGITYSFDKYIKINLRGNYLGKRPNPQTISATGNNQIGPYLILNGAITYLLNEKIEMQIIGKNITNTEYYHTSNRTPERYRQPQQTFLFSVTYNLEN